MNITPTGAARSADHRGSPATRVFAPSSILLRPGSAADLADVNRVVEAAVMCWDLPERVKRLTLPIYRYHAQDLEHLDLMLAEIRDAGIVGIAAWEPALAAAAPGGRRALSIHGLYVLPGHQRGGVGRALLASAEGAAEALGLDGVLVKAQPSAAGFFAARGYEQLAVQDAGRDYAHRFWKTTPSGALIDRAYGPDQE